MINLKNIRTFLFSLLPIIGGYILLQWYNKPFSNNGIVDYIHFNKTDFLLKQADSLKYAQDYDKAIPVFEKILNFKNLSEEEKIYTLNQLAYTHLKIYKDSLALKYLNKIESDFRNFSTQSPNALADFCYNHGLYCYQAFRPKEAEYWLKRALILYKTLYKEDHLRIAECMNTLGMYYYDFELTLDSAAKYIPLAHAIFKLNPQLRGYNHENELAMAQLNWIQRNTEAGQTHCEIALSSALQAEHKDSVFIGRCYSMKGNFMKKRGQIEHDSILKKMYFKEAEYFFNKAIEVTEKSKTTRVQEFYRDLIINYFWQNDSTAYFQNLNNLKQILKKQPDRYAQPERLKGYFFAAKNNTSKGINWYEKFYSRYINDSLRNGLLVSETLFYLSSMYNSTENFDKALYYMLKSAEIYTSFNNLTLDNIMKPNIYKLIPNQFVSFEKISNILLNKYKVFNDFSALSKSYEIVCLADELMYPNIASVDESAITTFQKEVAENLYTQALEIAFELYKKTKKVDYLDDAFRFCEKTKSFLLYRELSDVQYLKEKPNKKVIDNLRSISAEINKLRYIRDNSSVSNEQSLKLTELQDLQRDIYTNLKEKYPEYYRKKVNQPVATLQEVKSLLKANQSMIQFSIRGNYMYILGINRDTTVFIKKDSVNILNEYISNFQTLLKNENKDIISLNNYIKTASWLYGFLFNNLPPQFLQNKELLIIPDKGLYQIPFEALIKNADLSKNEQDFKNLPYLIYNLQISYAPAWKLYVENNVFNLPKKPRTLAFTYGDLQSSGALVYAENEINFIKKIFGDVDLAVKSNCSKNYFFKYHNQYDILHLSLHAESSTIDKRDNKIYFKLPLSDTLYGFDIERQNFTAQLAVLSACQTASGKTYTGEGVYSLSRSFLQGGVKHIIASLWKVDDWATCELMKKFYIELSKGNNPTNAIHQAKIHFLKNTQNIQYVHPHYWSSFLSIE
jgi:CHAT domain-containing protein